MQKENLELNRLYVLENDDELFDRIAKLDEEIEEVFEALSLYAVGRDTKAHVSEELFDVKQVINGIIDYLNIDFKEGLKAHNEKLIGRGWNFKKQVFKLEEIENGSK